MRCCFALISYILFTGLLVSCESTNRVDSADSTSFLSIKDTTQTHSGDSSHCSYKLTSLDSLSMLPAVAVNFPVLLFKQADTTSEVLHEIPIRSSCLIHTSDLLEMKSILRCIHDSCIGYVRRKDLFNSFPSASQAEKHYLVWLTPQDSVKVCRINTQSRRIEDQLSLNNTGVFIYPSLMNTQSWTETSVVIKIEMNPAACDVTRFEHIIDYKDKLKYLTTTSSFGDEDGSWDSYLVFKKDLLLHVVKTEKWQDDEKDPVHEKTEISEYQWSGDSLEFISINLTSGN